MDYETAIEPVTRLKSHSAELIRRARETGQPVIITQNGKASAILQDIESYQRQRESLLMLKLVAQGVQDHKEGRSVSHAGARKHFRKVLAELKQRE